MGHGTAGTVECMLPGSDHGLLLTPYALAQYPADMQYVLL